MNKIWLLLLPTCLLSSCAIGPLVELKLAEEGAKFVEREIEILEGDTTAPATKPIKK